MTLIKTGFARYALPKDDEAGNAVSVIGSAEDAEYPASNLIAPTNTGHLNLPSRPAKLTDYSGYWDLTFAAPVAISAVHLVYPNFDFELGVTLEPDGGTPIAIPIPQRWENNWWPSPFLEFEPQTSDVWRLSINAANSLLPQVGRLLLYGTGGFRDLGNDVRWGVVEDEEQGQIEDETSAGVETIYELFGPRRSLNGELYLQDATAETFVELARNVRNRILPWTLIPDVTVNDAWFVRFQTNQWARELNTLDNNIFPFRVKELSRGLPWP